MLNTHSVKNSINLAIAPPYLLYLLMFLWVLPFLSTVHVNPLTTFHNEWLAALLLLFAMLSVAICHFDAYKLRMQPLTKKQLSQQALALDVDKHPFIKITFPLINILLLGCLLALSFIQQTVLKNYNFAFQEGQLWLQVYLSLGIFCVFYAKGILSLFNLEKVIRAFAFAFVAFASIQTVLMCLQLFKLEPALNQWFASLWISKHMLWDTLVSYASHNPNMRLFANLNQPNQTTTAQAWGVVSALYLIWQRPKQSFLQNKHTLNTPTKNSFLQNRPRFKQLLKQAFIYIGLIILIMGMLMPASRIAYLQALAVLILVGLFGWRHSRFKGAIIFSLYVLLAFAVAFYALNAIKLCFNLHAQQLSSRANADLSYRISLYTHALAIVKQYPWFGVGFSQFAWHNFLNLLSVNRLLELANSAHNIVFDLSAKIGLLGAGTFVLGMVAWLIHVFKKFWRFACAKHLFALAFVCVLGIHAMTEYPQNYLYFLLPLVFVMSLFDTSSTYHRHYIRHLLWFKWRLQKQQLALASLFLIAMLYGFALYKSMYEFEKINTLTAKNVNTQTSSFMFFNGLAMYVLAYQMHLEDLKNLEPMQTKVKGMQKTLTFTDQESFILEQARYYLPSDHVLNLSFELALSQADYTFAQQIIKRSRLYFSRQSIISSKLSVNEFWFNQAQHRLNYYQQYAGTEN